MTGDKSAILAIDPAATAVQTVNSVSPVAKQRCGLRKPTAVAFYSVQVNQGGLRPWLFVFDIAKSRAVSCCVDCVRAR